MLRMTITKGRTSILHVTRGQNGWLQIRNISWHPLRLMMQNFKIGGWGCQMGAETWDHSGPFLQVRSFDMPVCISEPIFVSPGSTVPRIV